MSCRLDVASDRALDLEERDGLLRMAHSVCETLTTRHGGRLASKVGDRVIQHFGFPVAHENDARRAALAAIDIVEEITRLGEGARERGEPNVVGHIGLHTGAVIARELRSVEGKSVSEVVGATPEIATGLDALAGPGEIVLSDTTRRLVEPVMATAPIGTHPVGGLSGTVPLYRLVPGALASAVLDHATQFVGREDELQQLEASWARALEGQARCLAIRGEPGIGKSRLLRELHGKIEGARWLECRCLEESTDTPLRPVIDLFRQTGRPVEELLERYGFDVPATAPLFRDMLGLSLIADHPKQQLSPERESEVLIETLANLLLAMSLEEPTAVVLEDLHWADPSTRGLLAHLLLMLRQEAARKPRLLLLFTTRGWAPEDASVVALPPLSFDAIVELVRSGLSPDASLAPEILDLIVQRSDGVPLFVEEVTRELREPRGEGEDSESAAADSIPDSLEALLQARLDTLSDHARDTTQVAAALGREFDYELLRAVVGDPSQKALDQDLAELAREGFVFTRHTPTGQRCVFRHALIREAAYDTMLRDTRRACHARIAETLRSEFPKIASGEPQTLAVHLGEAGEHEQAAAAWHAAGRLAMDRAAYQEAISRFQKGLKALESLPQNRDRRHRELALLESLGMAYYSGLGYGAPQVEETFSRAESICEDLGEHVPLQILYGIWGVRFAQGDVAATAALVSRFLQFADGSEEPLAALYAHGCHGLRAGVLGELETADEQLALSTAECEAPENVHHIEALPYGGAVHPPAWWAWVLCWRGCVDRAREVCARMHAIDERLANAYGHAVTGHFSALVAQELEDVDAARELAEQQVAFSEEQKIVLWMLCSQCIRGWALSRRGEARAGIREIEQSLAMLRAIGFRTASSTFLARLADARLQAGDHEAGLASVKEGLALAETSLDRYYLAQLHRTGGLLKQAMGEREGALAAFREAIQAARGQGALWFELQAATDLARQLGESGRREDGQRVLGDVLGRISEGADTSPVQSARALLKQLA
jgi:class 3 adenylate cyclase/tetratricopeptide (TPR) repeat protein